MEGVRVVVDKLGATAVMVGIGEVLSGIILFLGGIPETEPGPKRAGVVLGVAGVAPGFLDLGGAPISPGPRRAADSGDSILTRTVNMSPLSQPEM